MIGPDIDKSGVAPDIVNAIRISPRHLGRGKVVSLYLQRLFRGKPLLAGVFVIADQFFLLGIDRDYRMAPRQTLFHGVADVTELCVTVGVILALLRLPIALQAIVEVVKDLGDLHMADGKIGRASCRERVELSAVAVEVKKI